MARRSKRDEDEAPEQTPDSRRSRRLGLRSGESVVMVATPARFSTLHKYLLTLGAYGLWRTRDTTTLTDQRILLGRGILRRTERSIPLHHVEDVVFDRRGLNSYVQVAVTDRGRRRVVDIGPMSGRSARRFATELHRHT